MFLVHKNFVLYLGNSFRESLNESKHRVVVLNLPTSRVFENAIMAQRSYTAKLEELAFCLS